MYTFEWILGGLAPPEFAEELAAFYSKHYGVWGAGSEREGQPVKVTPAMIRGLLKSADSRIAVARFGHELVGYAIALQTKVPRYGMVSWVTQLVVHEDHRRNNVGKTLLFTIWGFSDHKSWGLVSANPYAIRALEKATRRRCLPSRMRRNRETLFRLGTKEIPYIHESTELLISAQESRINTAFFLDHSSLPERLAAVVTNGKPWVLGDLPLGWEWFAFIFHDQQQIRLTQAELNQMLEASDEVTKRAYSRMLVNGKEHAWAKHAALEIDFLLNKCGDTKLASVLDFGCGRGRHVLELASRDIDATGVDYIDSFISAARQQAVDRRLLHASFEVADCRTVKLAKEFDAGICLYDVIGTYASQNENLKILQNLAHYVRRGGFILLSVMNMEFTERRAKYWFSISTEPDRLLRLLPSRKMETSGEVFDPEHFMIDRDTRIVYRKEQFEEGSCLPQELLVRDRRYTSTEIELLCRDAGLDIVWSRFVRAGAWEQSLPAEDAKEVLVLCRKP